LACFSGDYIEICSLRDLLWTLGVVCVPGDLKTVLGDAEKNDRQKFNGSNMWSYGITNHNKIRQN
jgi:hypothetical protein